MKGGVEAAVSVENSETGGGCCGYSSRRNMRAKEMLHEVQEMWYAESRDSQFLQEMRQPVGYRGCMLEMQP